MRPTRAGGSRRSRKGESRAGPPSELRILPITSERARGVTEARGLFDDPLPPAVLRRYVADRRNRMFVATWGMNIVGFIRGTELLQPHTARRQMFIYELAVHRRYRRRGVARALIERLLQTCRRRGFEEAFVVTSPHNRAAVRLYRSTGAITETRADRMFVYRF